MSMNGTGCLVNIYEEGYTGSGLTSSGKTGSNVPFNVETGVTALTGAADPFEYQEDNSSDLLDFIRYKTGYIRVIETEYNALSGLHPTSLKHHYVEAYYGSERVFTGYMQCAEYSDDWVACPRELEFPIVSPLGLLDAFNFTAPQTPGLTCLGKWMQDAINGLGADYANVVYPGTTFFPWDGQINSTIIVPFNADFRHYDNASNLYAPKDYKYFVEGVCSCFGWMVHDTPDAVVFSKFDATPSDSYSMLSVANLTTGSGRQNVQQLATALDTYYTNDDDHALQSVVRPLRKVELNIEGDEVGTVSMTTRYSTAASLGSGNNLYRGWILTQVGPNLDGAHIGTATFSSGGSDVDLGSAGLFPIAFGKIEENAKSVSLSEFMVLKYSTSWSSGSLLLKCVFFGMAPKNSQGKCLLKMKVERGWHLNNMHATDFDNTRFNLVIKIGSQYVDLTNETLSSQIVYNAIDIDGSTGSVMPNKTLANSGVDDCDGILFNPTSGYWIANAPIEVSIYDNRTGDMPLRNNEYIKFTELSLNNPSKNDKDYNIYYNDRNKVTLGGSGTGTEDESVSVAFNNYGTYLGQNTFGKSNGAVDGYAPTLTYMFRPLTVLTGKMKRTGTAISFNEYVARFTYWVNGWRWRLLAKSFCLRDDEYTLTIARSSVLE